MNGKDFKTYIFDEDRGNLVGEGTISLSAGKKIDEQIHWAARLSQEAFDKYDRFSELEKRLNSLGREHGLEAEIGSIEEMFERKLHDDMESHSER
ncbi:MAG: hypothetical protein ACKO96_26450, partial [Flammeovirgaceae bacterium]